MTEFKFGRITTSFLAQASTVTRRAG